MTAPRRIWVEPPERPDTMGYWQEGISAGLEPYTRKDIHPTADELRDAASFLEMAAKHMQVSRLYLTKAAALNEYADKLDALEVRDDRTDG